MTDEQTTTTTTRTHDDTKQTNALKGKKKNFTAAAGPVAWLAGQP
jgi:hypothetical protein